MLFGIATINLTLDLEYFAIDKLFVDASHKVDFNESINTFFKIV